MKKLIYFGIVFSFLCCSMEKKRDLSETQATTITGKFEEDSIQLMDLLGEFELVFLETTEESLIGDVKKIVYENNLYYVFDEIQQKILIFDNQGKYIKDIGKRGQGSCEFSNVYDFYVNDGSVEILSRTTPAKIIKYEPEKACIEYNFEGLSANNYIKHKNRYIFYQPNGADLKEEQFFLVETNSKGKVLSQWLPSHEYVGYTMRSMAPFFNYNDTILFYKPLDYNVYQIVKGEGISIRYTMDFGKYNMPERIKDLYKENFEAYIKESANYVQMLNYFFETPISIHFSAVNKSPGISMHTIYSKKTNNSFVLSNGDLVSSSILNPMGFNDNYFISCISPERLAFNEIPGRKKYYSDKYPPLTELFESIESDMNPIIIRYKYKTELFDK